MRKLIGFLSLFMAMLLASCGGGGGYAGDTGPTNVLRMSPVLSGVTLPVGFFSDVAVISQGVKPYHVLSSDPSVRAVLLDDNTLRIYAVGPGSSTVAVQDSSVSQTSISLEVTAQLAALTSSIGDALTLSPGQSQSFTVSGGGEPYTVTSSNPGVATVTGGANGTYTITTGNTLGTANILVTDAYGSTLTVVVTNQVAVKLAVSPTTVKGFAGTSATLNIMGGAAPYRITSSSSAVATASVSGSIATVNLLSAGTATLTIVDATSTPVSVTVTVDPLPPKFTAVPPSQDLAETGAPLPSVTYTLLNGEGPYYVSVPSQELITVDSGTFTDPEFTVTRTTKCVNADTTIQLTVTDASSGATATVKAIVKNTDPCTP